MRTGEDEVVPCTESNDSATEVVHLHKVESLFKLELTKNIQRRDNDSNDENEEVEKFNPIQSRKKIRKREAG